MKFDRGNKSVSPRYFYALGQLCFRSKEMEMFQKYWPPTGLPFWVNVMVICLMVGYYGSQLLLFLVVVGVGFGLTFVGSMIGERFGLVALSVYAACATTWFIAFVRKL